MTWENLKAPAEEISKLSGALSVTVGRLGEDGDSFYSVSCFARCAKTDTWQALERASIKLLDNNGLEEITVVIYGCRIIVARWHELACAVRTEKDSPLNKAIWRTVRRVGQKYDRRDPDNTQLGKVLGDLERADPEVAKAADNYDRMVDRILDR